MPSSAKTAAFVAAMLIACSWTDADAQRIHPSRLAWSRDTTSMAFQQTSERRQLSRIRPFDVRNDSTSQKHASKVGMLLGGAVGAGLGLTVGGLLAPGDACGVCYHSASVTNHYLLAGAVTGAITGATVVWWFSRRK